MIDAAKTEADTKAAAEVMREQRLQRNLKILVGGLGALILIGVAAVAIRMLTVASGTRVSGSSAPASMSTSGALRGEMALELPRAAKVVSVSVSGNRLVVHHESPSGTGIVVIDLDTGQRIVDIKAQEAIPRN